jgi:hypothetical protein
MARKKTVMEKKPPSIFRKSEINSLSDVFELYLFQELTQDVVNGIASDCGKFLHEKKNIHSDVLNHFSIQFTFDNDKTCIHVQGNNLLSSLWIIGVYPPNPKRLINKYVYENGDFVYKFYTENKNLSITQTNNYETKPTSN